MIGLEHGIELLAGDRQMGVVAVSSPGKSDKFSLGKFSLGNWCSGFQVGSWLLKKMPLNGLLTCRFPARLVCGLHDAPIRFPVIDSEQRLGQRKLISSCSHGRPFDDCVPLIMEIAKPHGTSGHFAFSSIRRTFREWMRIGGHLVDVRCRAMRSLPPGSLWLEQCGWSNVAGTLRFVCRRTRSRNAESPPSAERSRPVVSL